MKICILRQAIYDLTDRIQSPALLRHIYWLAKYLYTCKEGGERK